MLRLCTSPYRIPTPPLLLLWRRSVLSRKGKKESRKKRFNFFLFWLVQIFFKLIQFLFHWKNLRLCRQRNFKVKFRETKDDLNVDNTDQSTLLSKRYRRKTSLPFPRTIQWYWKRDNKRPIVPLTPEHPIPRFSGVTRDDAFSKEIKPLSLLLFFVKPDFPLDFEKNPVSSIITLV